MPAPRVVLADLTIPPDTSRLPPCDEATTAASIEIVRRRLLQKRRARLARPRPAEAALLGALRRLQNPQLGAYACDGAVVLSEPFNGVAGAVKPAASAHASAILKSMLGRAVSQALTSALAPFGRAALCRVADVGTRITIVRDGQRFRDVSAAVGRTVPEIDGWSAPPSGLFVVEERRMLLRGSAMRMAAAHEFAHALDAALAKRPRSYFSFESEELRFYFATSTGFINEYAATGLDEYFAESVRAYVEVNDPHCAWLPVTRQDLYLRDPRMFALVDRLFASDMRSTERRVSRRA